MTTFLLNPETDLTASVPRPTKEKPAYRDKHFKGGQESWDKKIAESSTVYVGNLSIYTTEYQLYELFGRCGSIKKIIMGLDKFKKTPCGFCFVEFDERESALKSVNWFNRHVLDGRDIQINLDAGYEVGREFGRGSDGGQISDERRRRSGGPGDHMSGQSSGAGPRNMLDLQTRSFAIVACISLISILTITVLMDPVESTILVHRPIYSNRYPNVAAQIRYSHNRETNEAFEQNFAQFLVNFLKSSKPTLLSAFMRATLNDKQLREQALAIFFNNTSDGDD